MFMQVVVKVVWNRAVFYSVQETSMKKKLVLQNMSAVQVCVCRGCHDDDVD